MYYLKINEYEEFNSSSRQASKDKRLNQIMLYRLCSVDQIII